MGNTSSKKQKQTEMGGDLYNEDSDVRRKLLTGFHMPKEPEGIEAISICLRKNGTEKIRKSSKRASSYRRTTKTRN